MRGIRRMGEMLKLEQKLLIGKQPWQKNVIFAIRLEKLFHIIIVRWALPNKVKPKPKIDDTFKSNHKDICSIFIHESHHIAFGSARPAGTSSTD